MSGGREGGRALRTTEWRDGFEPWRSCRSLRTWGMRTSCRDNRGIREPESYLFSAGTGVAPILPESHRMSVHEPSKLHDWPPGPPMRDPRTAQRSEVIDTPPRTSAWNSVVPCCSWLSRCGLAIPRSAAAGRDRRRLRSRGIRHLATVVSAASARAIDIDLFDSGAVSRAVAGQDVVVNLATHIPDPSRMLLPWAWRENWQVPEDVGSNRGENMSHAGRVSGLGS